ncbi:ABC transporter permease [Oenococcus oeni]|uniref:ABC transporter permease n=1 Tax=Oenococcus oeni TaxID=1247 RepID=UPI0010AFE735|nr:ABC-2 family transporter protein [Oenococcus oeni]SYW14949.1 Membrane protein [Oenococcus oeni]
MKYLIIVANSFIGRISYRGNEIIRIVTQFLQLAITLLMWSTIYGDEHKIINGFNLYQLSQYLIVTNLLSLLFNTYPIFHLANSIKKGQLNTLLIRPISVYGEEIAGFIGSQAHIIFLDILVLSLISHFNSIRTIIIFWIYIVLAFIMFFNIMMCFGTLSFWIINMWPLRSASNAMYLLAGGLYFPLSFFGSQISKWLELNPFALVADVPAKILTGQIVQNSILTYFLAVIIWTILASLTYRVLMKKGLHKYEGVGA